MFFLLIYFGAHLLARVLASDALNRDEAEQALWTQQLLLGYGPQPPLYTWLQWGVFQVFGVSVFSVALLKNVLLALTYAFMFLAASIVVMPPLAALASASMLLLPQVAWDSQRDLTHSVLLTALAALTLYLVLSLMRRPRPAFYVALGVAVGCGLLAKYNYVVFLAAIAVATLLDSRTRAIWRSPWMLAAFAIALMIVAPHALWLSHHWRQGSQQTLAKLDIHAASDGWARLLGLYSLAVEVLRFLGLWMVAMLGLFGASIWRRPAGTSCASCALWRRYALALLVLFVGMVIFGGVTNLKDRWLDPCLFMAPLAFFACASHLAEHPRLKLLPGVLAAVAVMILVLLIFRVLMSRWHGHPLNEPIRELAAVLRNHGYDGRASILTGDRVLGGDLRVQFPQAHVYVGSAPPDVGGNWLVIVKVEDEAQLQVLAESLRPMQAAPLPETAVLPYRYAYESVPPASYRFALLH